MIELAICLAFLAFIAWREREHRRESSELLQRIQSPEIAVRQFADRPARKAPLPVPINDDDAHMAARERRESLNGDRH